MSKTFLTNTYIRIKAQYLRRTMPTMADVWRVYVKPSMDGRLVIRKKGVIRRSERVIERNRRFAQAKIASACKGRRWKQFVSCLREQARSAGLTTRG